MQLASVSKLLTCSATSKSLMRSLLLNHLLFFPYFAKPVACELRSSAASSLKCNSRARWSKLRTAISLSPQLPAFPFPDLYREIGKRKRKLLSFSPHLLTLLRRRPQTTRPFNVRYRPLCITDHRDKYVRELLDK